MRTGGTGEADERRAMELASWYGPGESARSLKQGQISQAGSEAEVQEAALRKVEEAKNSNTEAALEVVDRHNEMVKKSQELHRVKARQQAIERQNQKRREDHSDLLAEMAVKNAERRDLLRAEA